MSGKSTNSDSQNPTVACPESTIDSAPRRDFIRKAALITVATGVGGGALLGATRRIIIPESFADSASSTVTTPGCNTVGKLAVWCGKTELTDNVVCASNGGYLSGNSCNPIVAGYNCGKGAGVRGRSFYGAGVHGFSEECAAVKGCACYGPGVAGNSNSICHPGVLGTGIGCGVRGVTPCGVGNGVFGCSPGTGVYGRAYNICGRGVLGVSCGLLGIGVYGRAFGSESTGVYGYSCGPCQTYGIYGVTTSAKGIGIYGEGKQYGVHGCSPAIALFGTTSAAGGIPIVARGASGQSANLQQWENVCTAPLSVVNNNGWLGIGTSNPQTALQVNGGISTKVTIATSSYAMSALDFGVLANASSAALTVTLPAASTALGMLVFVKKIDSSSHAVTLAASGTNKIEGKSSESLRKQYESYELVSDGSSNWYVIANDTK